MEADKAYGWIGSRTFGLNLNSDYLNFLTSHFPLLQSETPRSLPLRRKSHRLRAALHSHQKRWCHLPTFSWDNSKHLSSRLLGRLFRREIFQG
ncbi:Hypothetical predicted protein [Xyrichtys novacula]|uniref:Maturase K n=1 Tax=Xyrichtys novacula TaxID=13765 RepID=A0AAV1GXH7_XYRNO|nr:Hypothetical predicted protein [Xyrichtys novacula]